MHPLVKNTIKFFLFLAVSAFLFWLVYRDQNWDELLTVLKEDVNYFWIGVACVMGIASHVSRALRWQLLTASRGYRISFGNSFMGVMIGYFANLAIPRMGEFTRCGVVSKYEEVPFSKLLGTVVTERVIDMMILLFLTLIVVITQFKQVGIFLDNNQEIEEKVVNMFHSSWMLLVLVVLAAVGWLFWRLIRKTRFKERIHSFFKGLKEGLLSVKDVRHKGLFVFYSLFIWLMYFLMFYVCFFCFQFTSHLGALVGLTIFVLSSYGMVAPVQGGIGAWHFMVIAALMIYLPHTATVAQGGPEFEFRNNTNYPIKVVAEYYTSGGKDYLKVTLRGTKVDDSYVKIKTEVLETIPFTEEIVETDELAPGERKVEQTAYTGYKVKTYRNVYSGDGKLISSTFEASSNYKARNRIVLIGKSAAVTPTDPITPVDPGTTTPTDPTTPVDPGTTTDPGATTDPGVTDPGTTTEPPVEQEKPGWLNTGLDR